VNILCSPPHFFILDLLPVTERYKARSGLRSSGVKLRPRKGGILRGGVSRDVTRFMRPANLSSFKLGKGCQRRGEKTEIKDLILPRSYFTKGACSKESNELVKRGGDKKKGY